MTDMSLTFDALREARPGHKWLQRWQRSWPAYEAWFTARGGDGGPTRADCREALERHMPELVPVWERLVALTGNGDRAARFLSTWCPPPYLGGCSLAARADQSGIRLVRNYDLSPDLNEGLLLHSSWTGRPVMGMVEFLWGLSDGVNDAGLCIALAYGGRTETAEGFGITTILRYVLEVCETVDDALEVLRRVPSHMAYNLVLADRNGHTMGVEMLPGGGARVLPQAIATNHQRNAPAPRAAFTRTFERHDHLSRLRSPARDLHRHFAETPLRQDRYAEGFGTLFTAEYDPAGGVMRLIWPDQEWRQTLGDFREGQRVIRFGAPSAEFDWTLAGRIDWIAFGMDHANGKGRPFEAYLTEMMASRNCGSGHQGSNLH